MTNYDSQFPDAFSDLLEDQPRASYEAMVNPFAKSRSQKKYYQNQFTDIHNQFLGALGSQILGGQAPTLRFAEWLRGQPMAQNQRGFNQGYLTQTPRERQGFGGSDMGAFNPVTRFMW